MSSNGKIDILSSFDKKTITTLNSYLSNHGLRPSCTKTDCEYILSVKFEYLQKAIELSAEYINKKKLEVFCCGLVYWCKYAPGFIGGVNKEV